MAPKAKAPSAKAAAKAKAKTKAKAKAPAAVPAKAPPAKARAAPPAETEAPAKRAKVAPGLPDASDPLALAPLFAGMGHGAEWEGILRPVLEGLPDAGKFIGPGRDRRTVPVRELTFQALKPNPPGGWRVVSFGQSPYPRVESATGIAHFDSTIDGWEGSRFGAVNSMRCLIKAAATHKFGSAEQIKMPDLRKLLKDKRCVGPAEWFQALLTQGVLFINAAMSLVPPEDKSQRAGNSVMEHTQFWKPVQEAIVDAILAAAAASGKGVVFAWLGGESLKTKTALKACFARHPGVRIEHIEHKNPAAMNDAFCDAPNIFKTINAAVKRLGGDAIDWLPCEGWKTALQGGAGASRAGSIERMGDFIQETQDLLKMYLERLQDGLGDERGGAGEITTVAAQPLVALARACTPLRLDAAAGRSVEKAKCMKRGSLTVEEAAAVHFYTTNHLYKKLNEALRASDRKAVEKYLLYLRLFLSAVDKLPTATRDLYRGVGLDLSKQYTEGSELTWWSVSSCTPELKVAKSFAASSKVSTLFLIKARRGVAIREFSEFKSEEEFVLAPGTQFVVRKVVKKAGGMTEIYLEELDRARCVR